MTAPRAIGWWRGAVVLGAGLLATVPFCLRGWAEPDWRRPSLDELEVRVDEGAAEEAAFHKRFYRAVRIEGSDPEAARQIYLELLAERPETAYLYYKLAHLDRRDQHLADCVENFKKAIEHDPELRAAYDDLARIYAFWRRDDELIELCEQAVEHFKPDNIKYYMTIGELHERHERTEMAADVYQRAIDEHPVLYQPWLKLVELQLDAGQDEEAYQTYRDALEATGGHRALLVGVRELYLERGDHDHAFELAKLLVERFPSKPDFWYDTIRALLRQGKPEEARAAFTKSCSYLRGQEDQYLPEIVRLYVAYGDLAEAIAVLEQALEWEPESREALVALAMFYQHQGEAEKARALYQRLVELDPTSELALLSIAEGYERQGDLEAFGEWARRAVDTVPGSFVAQFALLRYFEAAGKPQEARDALDTILGQMLGGDEPDPSPALRLCSYYLGRGDYQQVRHVAGRALGATEDPPLVGRFYLISGLADYFEHRVPEAERKLVVAVRQAPALDDAHFYLGLCRLRLGQTEPAVESLERAVLRSPDPAWQIELGVALKRAGREGEAQEQFDQAIDTLEHAADAAPEDAEPRIALAVGLNRIGRNDDAAREFQRALELDPDSPTALNDLGYMWAEAGQNLDEALDLIKRAMELEPDSAAIADSLGWVYFQQGRYDEALRELERAVELSPPAAEIFDHVGDAHLKLGDTAKAIEWWNKAIELYPEDPAPIRDKIVEHGGTPSVE
jgi:tetratricopeptide (TPR) repeat protein